jgi:hypothetical protein
MLPGLQLGDQWLQAYNYKMVDDILQRSMLFFCLKVLRLEAFEGEKEKTP